MTTTKDKSAAKAVLSVLNKAYRKPRLRKSDDFIDLMIFAVLMRTCPVAKLEAVMKAFHEDYVDWNELRVSHVTEIEGTLEEVGVTSPHPSAQGVKDLLTGVHLERNHLEMDFLAEATPEEQVEFYGKIPALDAAMSHWLVLSRKDEGAVHYNGDMARAMRRLGIVPAKATSPKKVLEAIEQVEEGEGLLGLQLGLVHIGSEVCHARNPDCDHCKVQSLCSTGKKKMKPAAKKVAKTPQKKTAKKKVAKKTAKKAAKKTATKKATKKAAAKR